MLQFHYDGLGEFTLVLTVEPVDCTHEAGVLGECELTRYAHLHEEFTLLQANWYSALGYVKLQSIACPVEDLSLAGDQDTDLSNDIQPSQIVCKKEFYYIQYRTRVGT